MPTKKYVGPAPTNKAKADAKAGAEKKLKKQENQGAEKSGAQAGTTPAPAKTAKKSPAPGLYFPVVGVGASAGGL